MSTILKKKTHECHVLQLENGKQIPISIKLDYNELPLIFTEHIASKMKIPAFYI